MGGTWTAVRLADMPAVPMGEPRIQFTLGGQVHGETGCSDFEGPFTVEGNFLAIGPLKSGFSDPQCRVAPRQQEQAFLAVFRTADRIEELGRGRLRLSGPDGELLLLREGNFDLTADEAALLAQLREGPWSIVEATGSPSELRLPPLEFENSDFSAIGPCGITGSYRLRGDDLIQLHGISPSEVEACPAENDRLRTRLIDNLAMITTMKFDDPGRLTFRGTEVELILERP